MSFLKKPLFVLSVSVVFIALVAFFGFSYISYNSKQAEAQTSNVTRTLEGLAWSSNIGWISFKGPGGEFGDYGVTIDSNGNFSGRAWANPRDAVAGTNNIGWLIFNRDEAGGNPPSNDIGGGSGPLAKLNNDGTFTGWGRFVSEDGNGWDGWVRLGYGMRVTNENGPKSNTKYIEGLAWGDEVVGWVKMRGSTYGVYITDPCQPGDPNCPEVCEGCNNPNPTIVSVAQIEGYCEVLVRWTTDPAVAPSGTRFNIIKNNTSPPINSTPLGYDVRQYTDSNIPATGGIFTYKVQSLLNGNVKESNTVSINISNCTNRGDNKPPEIGGFVALPPGGVTRDNSCTLRWAGIRYMKIGTAGHICTIKGPGNGSQGSWSQGLATSTDGSMSSPTIRASSRYTIECTNPYGTATRSDVCRLRSEFEEF